MCGLRFKKTQQDVSQEINATSENSTTVMQLMVLPRLQP